MSKGSFGTPMSAIEYRKPPKGNRHCKECEHLVLKRAKKKTKKGKILYAESPYMCEVKKKPRHYTSVCYCKRFKKKEV